VNGRRRKALARKFREMHGRDPRESIKGLRDQSEAKIDRDGVRRWHGAFAEHGLLVRIEKMTVIQQSEIRLLKKAYKSAT